MAGLSVILFSGEISGVARRAACRYECRTIIKNLGSTVAYGFFFEHSRHTAAIPGGCNLFLLL